MPVQTPATHELSLVAGAGQRFESARRLLIGVDKPNVQNRENPRLITRGLLTPLAAQHPATLLIVLYLRFYASVAPLGHAAAV
jgi:hypothetical protein